MSRNIRLFAVAIVICLTGSAVEAQRFSGFQRGGGPRGGRPQSLINIFRDSSVVSELKLTDEQRAKIDEIASGARPSQELMGPVFEKLRAAKTDEESAAARAELQALNDIALKTAEAQIKKELTEEQYSRSKQLFFQQAGPRALLREDYAKEVGLSEDQVEKLKQLAEASDAARRELGFRASDEQRQKLREEFEANALKVLDEKQQTTWTAKLGRPLGEEKPDSETAKVADVKPSTPEMGTKTVATPTVSQPPANESAVVSFGTDSETKTEDDPENQVARTDEKLKFNFRYAPWADVLTLFAELSGLTLDLNDVPPGTFNYYDRKSYTTAGALDVLNGYLLQKGYILVKRDEFLVCLNIDNGIPPNLIPNVTLEDLPNRGRNELMNIVIPLEDIEVNSIASEIEQLVGPQGKVVALQQSNSLLITGIGRNLTRIHRLLQNVTAKADPDEVQFKSYVVKHVPVSDAEKLVRSLLGLPAGVTNVSVAAEYARSSQSRDRRYSSPPPSTSNSGKTQVTADFRTNKLLITATEAQHQLVEQALETVDVEFDVDGNRFITTNNTPELRVYSVSTSDPREVTKTLDVIMPGVVVNEDGKNGKVHIVATPAEHQEVDKLIRQLDGAGGSTSVSVLPLVSMDPLAVAATLRSMFSGDGDKAPVIEADVYGRRLLVRGTETQVTQVKSLLTQLGEDGTAPGISELPRGPIRSFPLDGRDPEQILPLLKQLWERSNTNPLRIVKPEDRNGGSSIRTPDFKETEPPKNTSSILESKVSAPKTNGLSVLMASRQKETTNADVAKSQDSEAGNAEPINVATAKQAAEDDDKGVDELPPVMITINGGELTLISRDEEALDRIEDLLQTLSQSIPVQTTWTIFYLRAADATEVAAMLEQLFPSSSVSLSSTATGDDMMSSLSGGITSFGSSLMDLTGLSGLGAGPQSLRIIPEIRLNALFVTGPIHQVREVEQMLEVLDSADLPDTLRERVPRMIAVEHADVNDVAAIIRDVYKDSLQDPAQLIRGGGGGRGGGGNPLAALLGGGAGGGGELPKVKLTIGVDDRTSNLIISADDSLFTEIKELVESIDEAAKLAKRSVVVVPLENTNPILLQQTLGSLMPRVKVSTSGSSRPRTTSSQTPSSPTQPGSAPSGGGAPDDVRRFFEERIRQRMQEQGGRTPAAGRPGGGNFGGRPGGGRPSGGPPGGGRGGDRGRGR